MRLEVVRASAAVAVVALLSSVMITAMPRAEAQAPTAEVAVKNNAFLPGSITVLVGTTVTWTQEDAVEHTVTVDDNQPEEWTGGILLPMNAGGVLNEFEHTFENLGTTTYHCEVHANMIGEVIVVESFDSPFVTVNANDGNEFSPEVVEINATEGVHWINSGSIPHTVTFEDASIGDLGNIDEAEEVRFNFTNPGSYRYRCTYHSGSDFETGMVGKVVVGGNASFPTVLVIDEPVDDAEVNGTLTVNGRVIQGLGQPDVTDVEYKLDEEGNWTAINITDLPEFTWRFMIETDELQEGPHKVVVRARSDENEVARDDVTFSFKRSERVESDVEKGTPGPGAAAVFLLVGGLLLIRRRRDCR